jgi:nitrogen PTS system EIIA component
LSCSGFDGNPSFGLWDNDMNLGDLIEPNSIFECGAVTSKKQVLEDLAARAAPLAGVDARDLFTSLLQRERLGSTGLGRGIAIPHVHVRGLDRMICQFIKLSPAIDFEAHDHQPVDLIFLLLSPEHASGDHLKALARISRLVRETSTIERLRSARDVGGLRSVLLPLTATPHAA